MKIRTFGMGMTATMALATAAYAQPAVDADLGTLTASASPVTGTLTGFVAGQTKWIKFTLPANVTAAAGAFLDIDTNGGTFTGTDTVIALFDSTGARVASDDESGPSSYSMLSFGVTTPSRAGLAATGNATAVGGTHTGSAGSRAAGTYYLGVSGWLSGGSWGTTGWTSNWGSHTRTGDVAYVITYNTIPTNPTIGALQGPNGTTGGLSPETGVLLSTTITPGANPASTGLAVTANLTNLGGPASQALFDDGTNGDLTAGDNIFSFAYNVPAALTAGAKTVALTVTDAQSRSSTLSGSYTIFPAGNVTGTPTPAVSYDLGTTPSNTDAWTLAANGIRWYKLTVPAAGAIAPTSYLDIWLDQTTVIDTQIGLYNSTGARVVTDDDDGNSTFSELSFGRTTPARTTATTGSPVGGNGRDGSLAAGDYWLAASGFSTTQWGLSNWRVLTSHTRAGAVNTRIEYGVVTGIGATGLASPATVAAGGSTTFRVTVSPAGGPPSTGIAVVGNLSSIGGSATQAFFDDGSNGDLTAGDNIWSYTYAVPGATPAGPYTPSFTVTDAQARSATGTMALSVIGPPTATNLGTVASGTQVSSGNFTVAASTPSWFKFTLPSAITATEFLEVFNVAGTNVGTLTDTEIAVFDSSGTLQDEDDDDGAGAYSAISYGATTPTRDIGGGGTAGNGRDGTLAAGTYYVAVAAFSATFSSPFGATSDIDTGDTILNIWNNSVPSTVPTGVASTAPTSGTSGDSVLFRVTVTPGGGPASTGLGVVANLTTVGGLASQALFNDGTNGDLTAGDNIWSYAQTVTGSPGVVSWSFNVSDAQSRSSSGTGSFVFVGPDEAGQTLATAKKINGDGTAIAGELAGQIGTGTDVDLYAIFICNPAAFSVTSDTATTAFDTQLFLFNNAGIGVAFNDDLVTGTNPQGTINGALVNTIPAGVYYVAINAYNVDPVDSLAALLWNNTPFTGVRAPDGPGALNALASWTGTAIPTTPAAYTLAFTGACSICVADFDGGNGDGIPDGGVGIEDLLFYLAAFEAGTVNADVDDGSGTGVLDGGVGIEDLLYYLFRFESGC